MIKLSKIAEDLDHARKQLILIGAIVDLGVTCAGYDEAMSKVWVAGKKLERVLRPTMDKIEGVG